jgi:hypothetical protein
LSSIAGISAASPRPTSRMPSDADQVDMRSDSRLPDRASTW